VTTVNAAYMTARDDQIIAIENTLGAGIIDPGKPLSSYLRAKDGALLYTDDIPSEPGMASATLTAFSKPGSRRTSH